MGNEFILDRICTDFILDQKSQKNKKWSWLKSRTIKTNKNNTFDQNTDDFIIEYNKTNAMNNNKIDIKSLDQRRVVFISLIGLYQSWRECPSFVLYSAILLLPLKKEWLYNPVKYINEIKSNFIYQFNSFSDIDQTTEFIKLLKWKDNQGLVFWTLNDYNYKHDTNDIIHPFWHHFNKKLTSLYDPISKNTYNPIEFNVKHWRDRIPLKNKYCNKTVSILNELYFLTLKFKPIQEIIYQSNKNSLLPIMSYVCINRQNTLNQLSEIKIKTTKFAIGLCAEFDDDDNDQDWWISDDYDPYKY